MVDSTNDLVQDGAYALPGGERVTARCFTNGAYWSLWSPTVRRRYLIDHAGAIRLLGSEDERGRRQQVAGEDGLGALTDFTVQDLRPLE